MKYFANIAIAGSIYLLLESGYQVNRGRTDFDELTKYFIVLATTISIFIYIKRTRFGVKKKIDLDNLVCENSILKIKIENRELNEKLNKIQ